MAFDGPIVECGEDYQKLTWRLRSLECERLQDDRLRIQHLNRSRAGAIVASDDALLLRLRIRQTAVRLGCFVLGQLHRREVVLKSISDP